MDELADLDPLTQKKKNIGRVVFFFHKVLHCLNVNNSQKYYEYTCMEKQTAFQSSDVIWEGYAVAQLVEALCYKPEGRGFDSQRCHWNFSST